MEHPDDNIAVDNAILPEENAPVDIAPVNVAQCICGGTFADKIAYGQHKIACEYRICPNNCHVDGKLNVFGPTEMNKHLEQCPNRLIPCPNPMCRMSIVYREFKAHLQKCNYGKKICGLCSGVYTIDAFAKHKTDCTYEWVLKLPLGDTKHIKFHDKSYVSYNMGDLGF
jgi:hypothetical protein